MQSLSGLDAVFLYAETPSMHLHVALVVVLDPTRGGTVPPVDLSVERVRSIVAERMHLIPPFTRTLADAPLAVHRPGWVEAPEVDLDRHIRAATLPMPGGPEDLGRMCGAIASVPLDRSRPLWEMWVLDGLHDENVALVCKVHHACVDGVSGAELMTVLFDLEPDPPVGALPPGPAPEDTPLTARGAEHVAESVRERTDALRHLPGLLARTLDGVAGIRARRAEAQEAGGTPLTAPRLGFNQRLTPERNCAFSQVPLTEVKALKDAARCTVNDVVLSVCAGALRRYLLRRGELPDRALVVTCPVSVRQDHERGQQNNRVSFFITRLHTEIDDPLERLHAIRRATAAAKAEHELLGPGVLGDWSEVADPTLVRVGTLLYLRSGLSAHHPPMHNLVVSNVPGPPFPVYFGGAVMERAYPMGPAMEGAGLNVTVLSYRESIDIGFMVCDDLMPDVWDLADDVEPAFTELREAILVPAPGPAA